jgi:DNA-binding NarL/FixJ family response regulator
MIADPYPVILYGLRKMIEEDGRFQVVAAVSTMQSFRRMSSVTRPDVSLLDWRMASQDPKTSAASLQSDFPRTSIILLTTSETSEETDDIQSLGDQTVLTKWCSAEELSTAISNACKEALPQASAAKPGARETISAASDAASSKDPAERIKQLTRRERQLLPLVCGGMKNKEIAMRLGISESTVWHHLTSVFTKLEVEDRLGLATFAYRHKLVHAHDGSMPFQAMQSVQ